MTQVCSTRTVAIIKNIDKKKKNEKLIYKKYEAGSKWTNQWTK